MGADGAAGPATGPQATAALAWTSSAWLVAGGHLVACGAQRVTVCATQVG